MLTLFIVFFFLIYMICEIFKYNKLLCLKKEEKVYHRKVVYLKLFSIACTIVLIIIHRFTKDGIMDRSNSMQTTVIYYLVLFLLLFISVLDVKKANAQAQ